MTETDHTELRFAHLPSRPDLSALDVKCTVERSLAGATATLAVIGSSHYVGSTDLGFHELCSCRAVDAPDVAVLPLESGLDRTVTVERDDLRAETVVEGRPLAAFPGPADADVAWRFGPEAYTTIDSRGDGYETYHTYPERDLALYTRTALRLPTDP